MTLGQTSTAKQEETPKVSSATKRSSSVGRACPLQKPSQGSDGRVVRGRTPTLGPDTPSPATDAVYEQIRRTKITIYNSLRLVVPLSLASTTKRLLWRGNWGDYFHNHNRSQPWPCRIAEVTRPSKRLPVELEDARHQYVQH